MSPVQDTVRLFYVDHSGEEAVTSFHVPEDKNAVDILVGVDNLADLSAAVVRLATQEIARVGPVGGVGAAGPYANAEDMARLKFKNALGNTIFINVSAPKATIFMVDGETVDPADALVSTAVTWLLANATDVNGSLLTEFVGGVRWRLSE